MRIAGGILGIIGGGFAFVDSIAAFMMGDIMAGVIGCLLGLVIVTGGVYALRRRNYLLAIAGASCLVLAQFCFWGQFIFFILGIPSLILMILSRGDFLRR
jgi:hypothetical protein